MTPLQYQGFNITFSCMRGRCGLRACTRGGQRTTCRGLFFPSTTWVPIRIQVAFLGSQDLYPLAQNLKVFAEKHREQMLCTTQAKKLWNTCKLGSLQTWGACTKKWGGQLGKQAESTSLDAVSVLCGSPDTGGVRSSLPSPQTKRGVSKENPRSFLVSLDIDTTTDRPAAAKVTGRRGSPMKQSPSKTSSEEIFHHHRRVENCGNHHTLYTYLKALCSHLNKFNLY